MRCRFVITLHNRRDPRFQRLDFAGLADFQSHYVWDFL